MGLARGWIWVAGGGGERVRCGEGVGSRRQRGVGGMGTCQSLGGSSSSSRMRPPLMEAPQRGGGGGRPGRCAVRSSGARFSAASCGYETMTSSKRNLHEPEQGGAHGHEGGGERATDARLLSEN